MVSSETSRSAPTPYDEVPYESHPYVQTHPDRLATVALLFGLTPPSVQTCRVLELGCAGGGNLVAMADALPEGRFLGIDLSSRQIEDGRRMFESAALDNVELRHMSILDVDDSLGRFDYVICHGVYSWVPPHVQEHILRICSTNLEPNGVAYVSYNTYPGWHMRGMVRDMMLFHAGRFTDQSAQVQQARALLDFLASSVSRKDGPYGIMLKEELDLLREKSDSYLTHDHLEASNEALYFHQFVNRAAAAGLQFLGEAQPSAMAAFSFPDEVRETLRRLSADVFHSEQYLDFLHNRMFRQTLLCHLKVPIQHVIDPSRAARFHVASSLRPVEPEVDLASDSAMEFVGPHDVSLTTQDPLMKTALLVLSGAWPAWIAFDRLVDESRSHLEQAGGREVPREDDATLLAGRLLAFYLAGTFLELHAIPPGFVRSPSERPEAGRVARYQATTGNHVTNLRHERVALSEPERHALVLLDGTRDRAALVDEIVRLVDAGALGAQRNEHPVSNAEAVREVVTHSVDAILPRLAGLALFVA